jgi:DNA-binding XRE family transcriptional regulator
VSDLKELRIKAGYSIKDVALITGVSESTIYKIEEGKQKPRPLLASKLAALYKVSIQEVLK